MTGNFLRGSTLALTLGFVGTLTIAVAASALPDQQTSRMQRSRCLVNAEIEDVMRSRFRSAAPLGKMPREILLDTLSIAGSTFALVSSDSICALARTAYVIIFHADDPIRMDMALAGIPAVTVVKLRPDRFWISATEFDDYQLYRRVLVDSAWRVVSKRY